MFLKSLHQNTIFIWAISLAPNLKILRNYSYLSKIKNLSTQMLKSKHMYITYCAKNEAQQVQPNVVDNLFIIILFRLIYIEKIGPFTFPTHF